MTQDNKYYTPSIEEFHVGFSYEELEFIYTDKGWYTAKEQKWVPKIYKVAEYMEAYYLQERVKRGMWADSIRVKYLDKEDIESLGFTERDSVTIQHLFGPTTLTSDEVRTIYTINIPEFGGLTAYLHFHSNERLIGIYKDLTNPYNHKQLFYGYIKNKSELKVLLKQLGIQ
jgi:hypothetical protein